MCVNKRTFLNDHDCALKSTSTLQIIIKDNTTYEELVTTLTKDLKTDLQKLRAIFYLVGSLNIEKQFYKGVTDPHTPRGHMKLIKLGKGRYTDFFALLCR